MTAQEIMNSEDFKACEQFHGHVCPGLSIGYRAAKAAMDRLAENRAEDEEVVAIVETDACSADAVQVLTGCTFGKGNFFFRDYGKMAMTLLSRNTGKGVRVSILPDASARDPRHTELLQKMMGGDATDAEKAEFKKAHLQRTKDVLETPLEKLFNVTRVEMELPSRAHMEPSENCTRCGEPAMPSKMERAGGEKICRGCAEIC